MNHSNPAQRVRRLSLALFALSVSLSAWARDTTTHEQMQRMQDPQARANEKFSRLDLNRDGFVDEQELALSAAAEHRRAIQSETSTPGGKRLTMTTEQEYVGEATAFLMQADADNDKRLNRQEYLSWYLRGSK
jgi:hypothetical protein